MSTPAVVQQSQQQQPQQQQPQPLTPTREPPTSPKTHHLHPFSIVIQKTPPSPLSSSLSSIQEHLFFVNNHTGNARLIHNKNTNLGEENVQQQQPPPLNSDNNSIQVVCRFRPMNEMEKSQSENPIVEIGEHQNCTIRTKRSVYNFTFDRIFNSETRQEDMFNVVGKPVVEDVCKGYNGTIFAYGQTGSGKTFTMMGAGDSILGYSEHPELKGVIPRSIDYLFRYLESNSEIKFAISMCFVEIYMEKIKDLLDPTKKNLKIEKREPRGIIVNGAREERVTSAREIYQLLKIGASNRAIAATKMNEESSRSHTILILMVSQKNITTSETKFGKLILVDLAGSEKIKKTGATGSTLEEAKQINKSLSALGMVITALTDGNSKHIPYRDSKLTRLLQDSLGGNSRTTLVINCSQSPFNEEETVSTLRFGERAKKIKNKAKVNRELTAKELKQMLEKAKEEVNELRDLITGLRNKQIEESRRFDEELLENSHIKQEIEVVTKEKEKLKEIIEEMNDITKASQSTKSSRNRSISISGSQKFNPRRLSMFVSRSATLFESGGGSPQSACLSADTCDSMFDMTLSETSSIGDDDTDYSDLFERMEQEQEKTEGKNKALQTQVTKLSEENFELEEKNKKLEQRLRYFEERSMEQEIECQALQEDIRHKQNLLNSVEEDLKKSKKNEAKWKKETTELSEVLNKTVQNKVRESVRNQHSLSGNNKVVEMLTLEVKALTSQVSFFDVATRGAFREKFGTLAYSISKSGIVRPEELFPASPNSKERTLSLNSSLKQ